MDRSIELTRSERRTFGKKGYQLLRKLGAGAYAVVYLGEFQINNTHSKLACKIIDTRKTPEDYLSRFLCRELNILANCHHPHIVAVHSIFERRHKFFIFMRYAERGDLFDLIHANGAVAEKQAIVWIKQLALALQYLHTLGIAHRDLKCENILITANYNAKLSDFGFSRSFVDANDYSSWCETFCGSLLYLAPEILKGNPYRAISADMWSFGVLIYVMLNKTHPFNSHHMASLHTLQVTKKWGFRSDLNVSDGMKELVENLLEPDVAIRPVIEDVVHHPLLVIPWNKETRQCEERALRYAKRYKRKILDNMNKGCIKNRAEIKEEPIISEQRLEVLFTSSESAESSESHIIKLLSKLGCNSRLNQNGENKQQVGNEPSDTKSIEENIEGKVVENIEEKADKSRSKLGKLKSLTIFNKCTEVINSECNSVFKI